jgi:hypothetical protein
VTACALVLTTTACQAVTRVTVAAGPAGDGTVSVSLSLDKAAASQFSNLAGQLRLDDLRRAGWTVAAPPPAPDGSETVTVSERFRNPAGASILLGQLSGPTGPFHALRLARHHALFSTRTAVSGTVDLRAGVDAFADTRLAQQLGVPSISSALAELHQSGAADPGLRIEVATHLPGNVQANTRVSGGTAVWPAPLGATLTLTATASQRNWLNVGLALVCVLCLLALVAVGAGRMGMGRRRGRRDNWSIAAAGRRPHRSTHARRPKDSPW